MIAGFDKYEGIKPNDWPPIYFNWDLSERGMSRTLDAPSGLSLLIGPAHTYDLRLGWVSFLELDCHVSSFSRQDKVEEFWQKGDSQKFARLIAHLSIGNPISPPHIKVTESGELFVIGGHHRYVIARELNIRQIPIYIDEEHIESVTSLVNVRWAEA